MMAPLEYGYAREVLRGVATYQPTRLRWRLVVCERVAEPDAMAELAPVIGFLTEAHEQWVKDRRVAAVNVSAAFPWTGVPRVAPDNREAGRMAARHLAELGFTRLAFIGNPGGMPLHYATERAAGFRQVAVTLPEVVPITIDTTELPGSLLGPAPALPCPIGIMAAEDRLARRILEECLEAGYSVPNEIAIIGVDNDALLTETVHPMLSSVDTNGQQVGFEAARLMEALLAGDPPPSAPLLIPPAGVVARESTAKLATEDELLIRALAHIREHAIEGLTVERLARDLHVTTKTLRLRYRKAFRESLKEEIRRVQIANACRLLAQTDMKIEDVGTASGFPHSGRFSQTFRDAMGLTPARYRRRNRMG
jgi:LacI family transcriptional regulator